MRLTDFAQQADRSEWIAKGYQLPTYDREALRARTAEAPTWLHFGAGNIFRAFPAAVLERLLNRGICEQGIVVAEGFDLAIIDEAYRPFDEMSLLVVLKADGTVEKQVVGSVTESRKADWSEPTDWSRLEDIFSSSSLQMVSFTITEKGYAVTSADGVLPIVAEDFRTGGLRPKHLMGKLTRLLYYRYLKGAAPIALVSMDNCSHNGDKLAAAVLLYAQEWTRQGLTDAGFLAYIKDKAQVSFPWSMIDKITPRPDEAVRRLLEADGFEDHDLIVTEKHTYTAAFVNAEETEYLVIEDAFPNGRPPLEAGGILFTERETVDKVEKMKVCTCLNPLHTALAIFGCLLGYKKISDEMKDEQLCGLVTEMGYREGMPVVVKPGILSPELFLQAVLTQRLPNPFMPDTPQRIATDTSQKLPIRFGETLKAYRRLGKPLNELTYIPLVLAGYARYLMGIDDAGQPFSPSDDPLLPELQALVAEARLGGTVVPEGVKALFQKEEVFGLDLYAAGLQEKLEQLFLALTSGEGAVRETLRAYVP